MSDTVIHAPRPKGLIGAVIDLFNSVWFGIILMVLIFCYMTVASAGFVYPTGLNIFSADNWTYVLVRKLPWIDATEMEVFALWPFTTLIALLTINMIVVTIKRIPLNLLNLGVWAIHAGIVILTLGSLYYFSAKIEGDTPVFRRHIVISVPGTDNPHRLVVRPDNRISVQGEDGTYGFQIQDINPNWPLLSGEDKGKTACSVNVSVTTPSQTFVRQMLIGYPQYTEDIIPGQGRAVKSTGKKLLDDRLAMSFAYEPQTHYYIKDTAALFVREVGAREWIERPIEGLPHYSDHIATRNEIWQPAGDPVIEPSPLNIRVPAVDPNDPLGDIEVRVTGRLHYVGGFEARWVGGGERHNPVLTVQTESGSRRDIVQLAAFDPSARTGPDGVFTFLWADSEAQVETMASAVGSWLDIEVPSAGYVTTIAIDEEDTVARNPDLPFSPLGESGWSYRVRGFAPNLAVGGSRVDVAIVEFKSADKAFTRWVADPPSRTRDVADEHGMAKPDPAIAAVYRPGTPITLIGCDTSSEVTVVAGGPDNRHTVAMGQTISFGPQFSFSVTSLERHTRRERRPSVVPKQLRNPGAGEQLSQIKLVLDQGDWHDVRWLSHHRYPLADEQYAVPRRFFYQPSVYTLPDGKRVEVLFSRKRWPLPAAIALEEFELKTHVGGFVPGANASVRDFVSVLRTYRNGKWGEPFTTSLNSPGVDGGLYFFQSEWDPGNMAFTGLGVGNRNGVYIQLLGCCVSVAGMIWVFYIKPIIKRRRRLAVRDAVASDREQREAVLTAVEPMAVGESVR